MLANVHVTYKIIYNTYNEFSLSGTASAANFSPTQDKESPCMVNFEILIYLTGLMIFFVPANSKSMDYSNANSSN